MREERDKIWKEFQEQRYKLGLCKSREKKKFRKYCKETALVC